MKKNIDSDDIRSLKQAYSARNMLTHVYYKVNPTIVWDTIQNDIPQFETMISGIIEKLHPTLKVEELSLPNQAALAEDAINGEDQQTQSTGGLRDT